MRLRLAVQSVSSSAARARSGAGRVPRAVRCAGLAVWFAAAVGLASCKSAPIGVDDPLVATLVSGTIETTVSQLLPTAIPVTVQGGTPPFVFTASGLPAGVIISNSGQLSGTPTVSGTFSVAVTVTDKNQNSQARTFILQVNGRPTTTVVAAQANWACAPGAACSFAPIAVTGGTAPFTALVSPTLPAGLTGTLTSGSFTISGTPTSTSAATSYTVTLTDFRAATAVGSFTLAVRPAITLVAGDTAYQCTTGASCAIVPATAAGGSAPLVFSIAPALPAPLVLNAATGAISGTPSASLPRTVFRVTVTDAASATAVRDFALTINAPVTAAVATAVVASTLNHPFSTAFPTGIRPVTGAGGTGTFTYAISPALRAGLAFDGATGAITGTPTVVGSTAHTVRVTDSRGAFAEAPFTLAIAPGLSATALAPRVCTQGAACTFTPVTATGGTGALFYAIVTPPALPTGLQLVGATGAVTGTPSVSTGAVSYTVRVVDVVGASVTQSFSLTVNPPLVTALGASAFACTVSAPCAFTAVTASGGTTPYGFSISPALPAGMSLSGTTGAVSGSPTVASAVTSYTLTVTDAAGATSSQTFTFGVNGPITATVVTPAVVSTAGVPFATAFPAGMRPVQGGGGVGTLLYAIAPALPSGLTFAPQTGAITGTPAAQSATTTHTVTISDNAGASIARTFTVTINPPITTTVAVPAVQCTINTACSATPVTATGGTTPRIWSVSPSMPAGLSFNTTTGAIAGTATNLQAAVSYTVTVRDAVGATATAPFTLTVSASSCTTTAATLSLLVSGTLTSGSCPFSTIGLSDQYLVNVTTPVVVELRTTSSAFTSVAAEARPQGSVNGIFFSNTTGTTSGHYLLNAGPWLLRPASTAGVPGAYTFSATVRPDDVDACRLLVIQTSATTAQALSALSCSQAYVDGVTRSYDEFVVWAPGRSCTIDMRVVGSAGSLGDPYLEAWWSDNSATFLDPAVSDDAGGGLDSRIQLANCADPNGNFIRLRARAFGSSDFGLYTLTITIAGASAASSASTTACVSGRASERPLAPQPSGTTAQRGQIGGLIADTCRRGNK